MDTTDSALPGGARPLPTPTQRATYRVTVRSGVREGWPAQGETTVVDNGDGTTTFTVLADQATLRGILCQMWDMNATLIAAILVHPGPPQEGGTQNE